MRDLLLGIMLFGGALYGLRAPWVAILGWTWISMMNPHALSWRWQDAPVAQIYAISAFIGILVSGDKKQLYVTRETIVLMLFMFWMSLTLVFSLYFADSLELWKRVMKIDLMLLVSLMVLYTRQHIVAFAWVVAMSLAFYGFKGGIFTIAHGGAFKVNGPAGGYIEGNNEIGLALVMTIPLLRFLQTTLIAKWAKHGMTVVMLLCAAAVLGTQSRGAFLAIGAMLVVLWWRSERRMLGLLILPVVAVALLSLMPETWWSRMSTIRTYDQDDSALGRLNAWMMAWNLACDRFLGAGFAATSRETFLLYAPEPDRIHAAHSIYFMVLGEHGFVGLFLFLLLFWFTWSSAGRLRVQAAKQAETRWLVDLASMCQVSLAGYAVGGAFLSLSYWDLPYNIMLMVVMGCRWLDGKRWQLEPAGPISPFAELMFWRRKKAAA